MLKPRLIPVLLVKNGVLVRSKNFILHQSIANPIEQVGRYADWKADELIYIDISRDGSHDYRQTMNVIGSVTSHKNAAATTAHSFVDLIHVVSQRCMIPLTVGGKIRTIDDIQLRLKNGADKVSINTQAVADPHFIELAARKFGSQCIVVSVDAKHNTERNAYEVYTSFGKKSTGFDVVEWCQEAEQRGAGEILLQSIDRDGTGMGYDLLLVKAVTQSVRIPVIALGGVGQFKHFVEGLVEGGASAVAAANIFHFTEQSIIKAKDYMKSAKIDVRI